MNDDPTRPLGERIASLEAKIAAESQGVRDLWEALKSERIKREADDDALGARLSKIEIFIGRIALLMALGSALGLLVVGSAFKYIESLIGRH